MERRFRFQVAVPWPRGAGTCLTNRITAVRIRPGLLSINVAGASSNRVGIQVWRALGRVARSMSAKHA